MTTNKLEIYSRSKNTIWTDRHIALNMLEAHLNYSNDAASRKLTTIHRTIDWIDTVAEGKKNLVDLGCGPGIYADELTNRGYSVTGIDISQTSIEYAKAWAEREKKNIHYLCRDYVNDAIEGVFDLALCIYCDFGALIPSEQAKFLKNIHDCLSDDGVLIFDVFGTGLCSQRREHRTWMYREKANFWSPSPHFELEESIHFKDEQVWGSRMIIIEDSMGSREYVTWDHYYFEEGIREILSENGFAVELINRDLIESSNFTSDDVMFIKAKKA